MRSTSFILPFLSVLLCACKDRDQDHRPPFINSSHARAFETRGFANASTLNDTVLAWRLMHPAIDADRERTRLGAIAADAADTNYGRTEAVQKFPDADLRNWRLYRARVDKKDLYWLFNESDTESIAILYEY
jgi:hypothetical protein